MKCERCIALRDDSGYEQDATECWCGVGEETREFADGSIGCNRKSVTKLMRDIFRQEEIEEKAFLRQCELYLQWCDSQNGEVKEVKE